MYREMSFRLYVIIISLLNAMVLAVIFFTLRRYLAPSLLVVLIAGLMPFMAFLILYSGSSASGLMIDIEGYVPKQTKP
jgi:hypothetical protein